MKNIKKLDIIMKAADAVKHILLNMTGKNGSLRKKVFLMR